MKKQLMFGVAISALALAGIGPLIPSAVHTNIVTKNNKAKAIAPTIEYDDWTLSENSNSVQAVMSFKVTDWGKDSGGDDYSANDLQNLSSLTYKDSSNEEQTLGDGGLISDDANTNDDVYLLTVSNLGSEDIYSNIKASITMDITGVGDNDDPEEIFEYNVTNDINLGVDVSITSDWYFNIDKTNKTPLAILDFKVNSYGLADDGTSYTSAQFKSNSTLMAKNSSGNDINLDYEIVKQGSTGDNYQLQIALQNGITQPFGLIDYYSGVQFSANFSKGTAQITRTSVIDLPDLNSEVLNKPTLHTQSSDFVYDSDNDSATLMFSVVDPGWQSDRKTAYSFDNYVEGGSTIRVGGKNSTVLVEDTDFTITQDSTEKANFTLEIENISREEQQVTYNLGILTISMQDDSQINSKVSKRDQNYNYALPPLTIPADDSGLSGGAIAGIVIATLVIVGLVVYGIYSVVNNKSKDEEELEQKEEKSKDKSETDKSTTSDDKSNSDNNTTKENKSETDKNKTQNNTTTKSSSNTKK